MNNRHASWVLGSVAALLLCCGGLVTAGQRTESGCKREVENARKTVRTDSQPIRAELAPLGEAIEVHWILSPDRHCDILPVPGTERDRQSGVVKIDPVKARDLVGHSAGWETVKLDATFDAGGLLSPYIPSGGAWQHIDGLDAQFVGENPGEEATYYVNVDNATVLFSSYADHFSNP